MDQKAHCLETNIFQLADQLCVTLCDLFHWRFHCAHQSLALGSFPVQNIDIHLCMQMGAGTYMHICMETLTHWYTSMRIHTHTQTRLIHIQEQRHTQTQTHRGTDTHTHTHTHTDTHTNTLAHTYTHTCNGNTNLNSVQFNSQIIYHLLHGHTHTHTHTHTQMFTLSFSLCINPLAFIWSRHVCPAFFLSIHLSLSLTSHSIPLSPPSLLIKVTKCNGLNPLKYYTSM